MRTYVTHKGIDKEVKNLGWLSKRVNDIQSIILSDRDDGARVGCKFVAIIDNETIFTTSFNSYEVAKSWIARRQREIRVTDIVNLV